MMQRLKSLMLALLRGFASPVLKELRAMDGKLDGKLDGKFAALSGRVDHVVDRLAEIEQHFQTERHNLHQIVDQKQDLHTRLLNEANDKHDTQLAYLKHTDQGQNFSVYLPFGEALRPEFHLILRRVLCGDYPFILRHAEQLFTEVLIDHLNPGGIWRLQRDVAQFAALEGRPARHAASPAQESSAPLAICIVSGCFPSQMHGGGGRLLDIIDELAPNHRIDLFSHYNPALDESSLALLQGKLGHIKLVEDYEALTVQNVEAWLRSINRDLGFYDVIQLEYPQTVRFINPLRKYGKRIGFTFMECLSKSHAVKVNAVLESGDYEQVSAQARAFWAAVADEKHALDNADFCVAVTDDDAQFLKRLSPCPTCVVPTCLSRRLILDEAARLGEVSSEGQSVVFIGFFGHWPNLEAMQWYLSAIHPIVKARVPGYHFTIVGSGDVGPVRALCTDDATVTVTGKVESIVPYILKAKVCVSPLVSGAGIRGKQNQYAALGRPSVTTSIGNMGLPYAQGESVMIADQAADFAESVIRLLTDDALYAKIQQEARTIALARYTWPPHLDRLLALYRGQL